jgi:ribonucleotide reductase beta subunit family protein with ferritin-like domain
MADPLLVPTTCRFTTFPIQYPEPVGAVLRKAVGSFWTAEEINLGGDLKDWATLNDNEQHFIKMVLAFFAASDGIVMENINLNSWGRGSDIRGSLVLRVPGVQRGYPRRDLLADD